MIEFWARWHMTLTRFLTAYVYNPMALALTRRRMGRGRPVTGGRGTTIGAFLELTTFPLIITMFLSGLWHGAGYLFILWGVLHGVFLTINHGWRLTAPYLWTDRKGYERFMRPVGLMLTLACVVVSMVLFRAPTIDAALGLLQGLTGVNGVRMEDAAIADRSLALWILLLGVIAIALPNTLQMLSGYRPALDWKPAPRHRQYVERIGDWQPSPIWGAVIATVAALSVLSLSSHSEFLYWQF
jgi:D-alanyl-lipoteichoic acid acyltransferase DltB (MBOAT superfamily)